MLIKNAVMIDATGVTRNKAGVGVYAKNLLDQLVGDRNDLHLVILVQDDDPDLEYGGYSNVTMIRVPARFFRKLPLRFLLEQFGIPLLLLKYRVPLLHSLHYSFPLLRFRTKQVVTLHDMTFFDFPEMHERFKVVYFRFFIRAAVHLADYLIFVSHSARRDCVARLGPPRGSSTVIYHGKGLVYRPDLDPVMIESVRNSYSLPKDFILYIGTIEPRKNLSRLVSAFADSIAANHPDVKLVIAGMKGWMYQELFDKVEKLGLRDRVIFPGFIREEDKPYLLAGARVFVYPSLYEGFGLPVLEALACSIPTVTSDVSSIPEVAGDAALLVDPTSEEQIANALERLLTDPELRDNLRRASVVQAAKFSWEQTAVSTAAIYKQLLLPI